MNKRNIVIVDDEQTNIALLSSVFDKEQYEIHVAYDGQEGLDLIKKVSPALVLLDVMMPKVDGFKVCGLLKSDQRYAKIPVIILSSRAGDEDFELSKKVGAEAYMLKPIDKEEVKKEADRLLN